ncbi:MAG: hypothetical protein ACRYHA_10330 [Janthinobacterium lividum]
MTISSPERIVLSDDAATLLAQASHLTGETRDWPHTPRVALVNEDNGGDVSHIEETPAVKQTMQVARKRALEALVAASKEIGGYDLYCST